MRIVNRFTTHDCDGDAVVVTVTEETDARYRELTVGRGPGGATLWRTGVDRTADTAADLAGLDDLIAALTAARALLVGTPE